MKTTPWGNQPQLEVVDHSDLYQSEAVPPSVGLYSTAEAKQQGFRKHTEVRTHAVFFLFLLRYTIKKYWYCISPVCIPLPIEEG